jgi:hypothetical protein
MVKGDEPVEWFQIRAVSGASPHQGVADCVKKASPLVQGMWSDTGRTSTLTLWCPTEADARLLERCLHDLGAFATIEVTRHSSTDLAPGHRPPQFVPRPGRA